MKLIDGFRVFKQLHLMRIAFLLIDCSVDNGRYLELRLLLEYRLTGVWIPFCGNDLAHGKQEYGIVY